MALLHRMRGGGGVRLSGAAGGWSGRVVLVALLPVVWACSERETEPRNPPDSVLRDSLGLTEADQVHRIELSVVSGAFALEPDSLAVPRGAWVEFVTSDGWPKTVTFELDSLMESAAELLRSTGQASSPPLLEPGVRFVISFAGAPAGRYPYRVEGSGRGARGVVVVTEPEGGG